MLKNVRNFSKKILTNLSAAGVSNANLSDEAFVGVRRFAAFDVCEPKFDAIFGVNSRGLDSWARGDGVGGSLEADPKVTSSSSSSMASEDADETCVKFLIFVCELLVLKNSQIRRI